MPLESASLICVGPLATHSSGDSLSMILLAFLSVGRLCASNTTSLSDEKAQSAGSGVGRDVMAMSSGRMMECVKWSMFYTGVFVVGQ
jgi:hypothetical protein